MSSKEKNKGLKRRLAGAWVSSIVSISLLLLLIGIASLVLVNAGSVSKFLKEEMKVSVLLKQDATEAQAGEYVERISTLPYVREVRLITREEGEAELKEMLGEDFLSVFETSPVPISVDVGLKAEYVVPDSLAFVTSTLANSSIVDEIDNRQGLVETLNANIARISLVFGAVIALLLFVSVVLINNMVRLNVFSKRFTIHTMKLVGATRAFIRAPFLRAAALQGLVSALIASACIWGMLMALKNSFPELYSVFRSDALLLTAGIVLACGVLVCVVCTFFVVNKLVSASKDDLYY